MEPVRLPRPDLFIAALGRSGSTMLANLLTTPPNRWVMIEPRFANGSTGTNAVRQAQAFGFETRAGEWQPQPGESEEQRIWRFFAQRLASLDRWGLKEVRYDLIESTYDVMRPVRVVVLVRDVRAAARSLVEKTERDHNPRFDDRGIHTYLKETPRALLRLADRLRGTDHMVIRYEDFVSDPSIQSGLSAWLDWPLNGDPRQHLSTLFDRQREVELHGSEITENALNRSEQTHSARANEIAEWAADTNVEFQRRFGYRD